jgi:prephenate dehydrogenase
MALRRAGQDVLLLDRHAEHARTAAALGAGRAGDWADLAGCDHVVLAVPPTSVGAVLRAVQQLTLDATISDVASTKANVLVEVEAHALDATRFCGGHPIAGRERGGPTAAVPELFDESVWVVTPSEQTDDLATADVVELARRCGARPLEMTATAHDSALAVVSHAAQVVASTLAAQLDAADQAARVLAGSGFRDTTRLADSDAGLWADIAVANRTALAEALRRIRDDLDRVQGGLRAGDVTALTEVMARGRAARASLPGKAGRAAPTWSRVGVVLQDQPGELARLFGVAGRVGVNIEDVAIDHAVDHPVGLVALDVRPEDAERLTEAVGAAGWHAIGLTPRRL